MSVFARVAATGLTLGAWGRARRVVEESAKYLAASFAALAVDFLLLVFLTEVCRVHYLISAALSFTAGLFVTYVLSVTIIFREHRYGRRAELAGFVAIGLVGLILNEYLLRAMVEGLGVSYVLAKAPAAGISFLFNFVARRIILFTAPARREIVPSDG